MSADQGLKTPPDSHLVKMATERPDIKLHQTRSAHTAPPQECTAGRMGAEEQQTGAGEGGPVGAATAGGGAGTMSPTLFEEIGCRIGIGTLENGQVQVWRGI